MDRLKERTLVERAEWFGREGGVARLGRECVVQLSGPRPQQLGRVQIRPDLALIVLGNAHGGSLEERLGRSRAHRRTRLGSRRTLEVIPERIERELPRVALVLDVLL